MEKIGILIVPDFNKSTLILTLNNISKNVSEKASEIVLFTNMFHEINKESIEQRLYSKIHIIKQPHPLLYGAYLKKGFQYFIENNFTIIALLHGNGLYKPKQLDSLISLIEKKQADAVFGSRFLGKGSLLNGMPLYKFIGNRILTTFENALLHAKLSEFHSGYRAYSVEALKQIPFHLDTDDYHIDTQVTIQLIEAGFRISELPIPTYHKTPLSSFKGMKYAKNVVSTVFHYRLHKSGFKNYPEFAINKKPRYSLKLYPFSTHSFFLEIIPTNKKILDIGCGSEYYVSRLLAEKSHSVMVVDLQVTPTCKDNITVLNRNLETDGLSLEKQYLKYFDYIIAGDILEHIRNYKEILIELKNHLQDRGHLLVSTGNIANFFVRMQVLFGRFNYTNKGILDKTHVHFFTKKTLITALKDAGFKSIKVFPVPIPFFLFSIRPQQPSKIYYLLNLLYYLISKLLPNLFAYQFVVLAEKDETEWQTTSSPLNKTNTELEN